MVTAAPMAVIIRLDRIIHAFPLDCPIKSGNDGKKTYKPRMSISTKWQAGMREAKAWWQHLCGRKDIMFSRKLFI